MVERTIRLVNGKVPTAALAIDVETLTLKPNTFNYNTDGTIASVIENGITTTYTYNSNGTVNTETRLGKRRTWSYDSNGNCTSSTVTDV